MKKNIWILIWLFIPVKLWAQYYDSTTKEYYYRFVSQSKAHHPFASSVIYQNSNYSDSAFFCGLIIDQRRQLLKNVRCEFLAYSDSGKTILFTDSNGKFKTNLKPDMYTLSLSDDFHCTIQITSLQLNSRDLADFEFLLQNNHQTIIRKFKYRRRMGKGKMKKIQDMLNRQAESQSDEMKID